MDTIVLYYSMGGSTRRVAEARAKQAGATLLEIRESRRRTLLTAFIPGCPQALNRKASKILPLEADLGAYGHVIVCCPVWAGFPAPAFNAVLALIPAGRAVTAVLCSGGGETPKSREETVALLKERGYSPVAYEDVRTAPEAH